MNRVTPKCKLGMAKFIGYALTILLGLTIPHTVQPNHATAKKVRKGAKRLDKKMKKSTYGLFGIRVHGNFANLDTAQSSDPFIRDPSRGASVGFGVTFDKGLNNLMSLRLDVLYQNKNFSSDGLNNYNLAINGRSQTNTYMDFIEVPIMLVARFMHGQFIRPYVGAGLYGAALVTVEGDQEDGGALDDARRPFSLFDYGFVLSGGTYFVLAKGAGFLSAELRYSRGLANIADTDVEATKDEQASTGTAQPLSRQQYNMNNLSLMLGYYF